MASFGERLQLLRNGRNMTQEDLGNKFQISKSAVGMYERDEREPSFALIQQFADFFDVSTDYLLGRTSTPQIANERDEIPDVDRIAAHMEAEYGEYNPEMARFLKHIIRETIEEYDRKKKQGEQKD